MRLIDAEKLYKRVKTECNPYGKPTISFEDGNKVLEMIKQAETIEERTIAHWEWDDNKEDYVCSECGATVGHMIDVEFTTDELFPGKTVTGWALQTPPYCQICGSKMDNYDD